MAEPLFKKIRLDTHLLDKQREFYACCMGLPMVSEGSDGFSVQAGATELEFVRAEPGIEPLYHFALNIPENQIGEALAWTSARATVPARSNGEALYDFETWNSHAFYFLDAAGNLLEFIARHSLRNARTEPFTANSVECVSEMGLSTTDVRTTSRALMDNLGIACYPDSGAIPADDFQAVGNEYGLFIVAKVGRIWLGSEKTARPYRSTIWTSKGVPLELGDSHARIC
jgi:catechol-2,3-dioxygenase